MDKLMVDGSMEGWMVNGETDGCINGLMVELIDVYVCMFMVVCVY